MQYVCVHSSVQRLAIPLRGYLGLATSCKLEQCQVPWLSSVLRPSSILCQPYSLSMQLLHMVSAKNSQLVLAGAGQA